jgi:NADH:ubiquinone oxidoreductase subunit K
MNNLLTKLGQNPKRSLSLFLSGLGLFAVGLIFITIGYFYHHHWQILGLFILALACAIAAWGYLGIFANRLLVILSKR